MSTYTLLKSRRATLQLHILKLTTFSKFNETGRELCSLPFYTFCGGYIMCLRVDAGGAIMMTKEHVIQHISI